MRSRSSSRHRPWLPVLAVLLGLGAVAAAQSPPNGGFEDGDLNGWSAGGAGMVEALQATNFSPNLTPPEGSWFALLSTGAGANGGPTGYVDGNGRPEYDITTLSITFTLPTAPSYLSFQWAFVTSEASSSNRYDDVFDVTLDGVTVLARSSYKPGGVSDFQDTPPYQGVAHTVTSAGPTNGHSYSSGRTDFYSVCIPVTTAGSHTLEFRVADQTDDLGDSGLLIDDLQAPSGCSGLAQVTDGFATYLELKGGGFNVSLPVSKTAAVNADGSVIALVSSANCTGDNPNLQEQVFVADGTSFERVTTLTGASAERPALSADGRWVVFASDGDLVPGGNADGSMEVFRWDRASSTMTQITSTTACTSGNKEPTLAGDAGGDMIAFTTDCTDLAPGFNADGNREVVVWDSGVLETSETTGCESGSPFIDRSSGGWVAFHSTCDLLGGNADGNQEVYQLDRGTGTLTQLTSTAAASGELNAVMGCSDDGRYVLVLSNADPVGTNPDASLEVFRVDRLGPTTAQLTAGDVLTLNLSASIDASGQYVAVESLDALSSDSEVGIVDVGAGTYQPVASGTPSLPVIAESGGEVRVVFVAADDYTGNNADGSMEVWTNSSLFGEPPPVEYCSSPDVRIPDDDPAGVSDDLVVADSGLISDLDVSLVVEHTWVGDLVITLEHVDTGTTVTLIDRPGLPAQPAGCSGDNMDTILDDEADLDAEDVCGGSVPTIAGTLRPNGLLSAFDGEDVNGTWRLTVTDLAWRDRGRLLQWCLEPSTS